MLIKKHPKVCKFYETIINRPALSNCICCNNQECPITISENPELPVHEIDDDLCSDSLSHEELFEIEKCCQHMLQDDTKDDSHDESLCESQPNIECLRNSNAQALRIGLDVNIFLENTMHKSQVSSHERSLKTRMNEFLTKLQTTHLESFEHFLKTIWNKLSTIVSSKMSNSRLR